MLDIIIIGAGPAGLTAGLYAVRAGMDVLVLEAQSYGGQMALTPEVENFPSIQKISGWELAQNIYDQAVAQGVKLRFETVKSVEATADRVTVTTGKESRDARALIIANGAKRRTLGIPGEDKFTGRGVSYCATCDGAFFKDRTAVVIGGGNTALEDALYLANICRQVYLVHRRDAFRGEKRLGDAVLARENIEVCWSSVPVSIEGEKAVERITLRDVTNDETRVIPTDAVFVAIGLSPDNSLFASCVELDKAGYVLAGEDCRTSHPRVFAAGDTRTKLLRQIITAASDGAVAAFQAANQVNEEKT